MREFDATCSFTVGEVHATERLPGHRQKMINIVAEVIKVDTILQGIDRPLMGQAKDQHCT
uniref:Uncharacterized protein n=1 Tax=Romanomermis culicivorax TaxID=13658 RepID=A0A915IMJ0_ROMCU